MANKKYNEFPAGSYDTAKIFLQADTGTGALEQVTLPVIPDSSLLVPYINATAALSLGIFELQSPKLLGGSGVNALLSFQGTSGIGTPASAAIKMLVGNNGATTAMTILNSGNIGIGSTNPQRQFQISSIAPTFLIEDTDAPSTVGRLEIAINDTDAAFNSLNGSYGLHKQIVLMNLNTGDFSLPSTPLFSLPAGSSKSVYAARWRVGDNSNNFVIQDAGQSQNVVEIEKNGLAASLYIKNSGSVGFGSLVPTATVHIKAGSAIAGTAPIKLNTGALLTTIENGAIEWDGTNLHISQAGIREQFAYISNIPPPISNLRMFAFRVTMDNSRTPGVLPLFNSTTLPTPSASSPAAQQIELSFTGVSSLPDSVLFTSLDFPGQSGWSIGVGFPSANQISLQHSSSNDLVGTLVIFVP